MKFEEYFKDPNYFSDGSYVISGKYSREEAAEILSIEIDEDIHADDLTEDRVRWGFPPENIVDYEDFGDPTVCWYTGASGKGSKKVWVLER